jgi:heptaprenyl diphosphate synthase
MTRASDRTRLIALLGALCLFLSTVEFMIPKPLPFMRLGLANLPILVGLSLLTVPEILILVALKVAGQGLVNGTLFSYIFLFSAAGSLASGLVMLLIHRAGGRYFSLVGISILGALSSNLVQLLLSRLMVFGDNVRLIAPPFLAVGTATAVVLGLMAERFLATSEWISLVRKEL